MDRRLPLTTLPPRQGLYDPANEHDSCGVGFVAHIKGQRSHQILIDAEDVLRRVHETLRHDIGYPEGLAGKKVQYTDSDGRVDRLLHENGVFKGFAPGPWPEEEGRPLTHNMPGIG